MSSFDFGSMATQEVKNSNYLRAYDIYEDVKFTGVDDMKSGTSAKGNNWKSWALHFECPQGEFVKSIFEPLNGDRPKFKNANGHEYERPSTHETNLAFLFLVGQYFNPEGLEKMKKNMSKVTSYEDLMKLFKLCIVPTDKTTKLKLTGRNNDGTIYADVRDWCGINKENKWFPIANSIFGDKVAFSNYEIEKKREYESAKPTTIKKDTKTTTSNAEDNSSIDIDSLL